MQPKLPKHIAIVMDGNGRWAKQRHLPRMAGHYEGLKTVKRVVRACAEANIEVLTLFAFSSENWQRPLPEVKGLMGLFLSALQNEVEELHKNNIQMRIVGDCSRFSPELLNSITKAQQLTANNTGLKLIIAADYGGRWDIVQAARKFAQQVEQGKTTADTLTQELFASLLEMADLPEPDLFIRTSGERRISNFMLWQLAYTEFYFTDIFWPDVDSKILADALSFYASRQRRFGHTGEQIEQLANA